MNHALAVNFMIMIIIALALWITKSPLVIIGILYLKELPYGLVAGPEVTDDEEEEPEGNRIGFV